MKRQPPYCHWKKDRRGGPGFWYFTRKGYAPVRLSGLPWSPAFMAAYEAAMKGEPLPIGAGRVQSGTMADLVTKYYASPAWRTLKPGTQRAYRRIIEKLREHHGSKFVHELKPKNILKITASIEAPSTQKLFVIVIKILMEHGISCGMLETNPARDVKTPRLKIRGHHSWTEGEIAQFEAHYARGSRERLALALLIHTGQRRGDIVRMGPQHIKGGYLNIVPEKTNASTKTELTIPVHPELAEIIDSSKSGHLAFLTTRYGTPFTPAGFGNWFREACKSAGLPDLCRSHGIRKAVARRLAEAGASTHEIAAITGHGSLSEVERYTKAANKKYLAESGQAKVIAAAFPRFKHEE
jgi:integrase